MVLGRVGKASLQHKDAYYRQLISRLYHHSQAQGNNASYSRQLILFNIKSLWTNNNNNAMIPLGFSACLMLGMTSVVCYLASNEQQDGQTDHYLLQGPPAIQISEERRSHLFRPNIAHCEGSHSVPHQHHQQTPSILSPTLPYRILRPNPHLEIAFCTRTRNPIYVLEKDVLYNPNNNYDENYQADENNSRGRSFRLRNRRPNFFEEKSIPTNMRSRLSDYKHSGWDRGHLAPAADFSPNTRHNSIHDVALRLRIEEQLMKEQMHTYNLCNISPQDASLNRGLWSKLEAWVRSRITELHEEDEQPGNSIGRRQVHVLTGPLWMPTHFSNDDDSALLEYRFPGIGKPPSLVAVPTHFFKVVVVTANDNGNTGRIEKFACFVMANRPTQSDAIGSSEMNDDDQFILQDFLVPWSTLETVSGLEFFSHLVDDDFRKRADELTLTQVHRRQRQSQSPRTPTLQLLEAGKSSSGGRRQLQKELEALEHLCKGGKCRK